jgi:hypothetical protein
MAGPAMVRSPEPEDDLFKEERSVFVSIYKAPVQAGAIFLSAISKSHELPEEAFNSHVCASSTVTPML